jgi:hypothetical protein
MITRLAIFIFTALLFCGCALAKDQFEIGKVHAHGILRLKTFYGPPGYGESPATDRHEQQFILIEKGAPTIEDQQAGPDANSNVTWLQLFLGRTEQELVAKKLIDRCIWVEGMLRFWETGHDNTPLTIDVAKIEDGKNLCD